MKRNLLFSFDRQICVQDNQGRIKHLLGPGADILYGPF
jgi:hypothetical protein